MVQPKKVVKVQELRQRDLGGFLGMRSRPGLKLKRSGMIRVEPMEQGPARSEEEAGLMRRCWGAVWNPGACAA